MYELLSATVGREPAACIVLVFLLSRCFFCYCGPSWSLPLRLLPRKGKKKENGIGALPKQPCRAKICRQARIDPGGDQANATLGTARGTYRAAYGLRDTEYLHQRVHHETPPFETWLGPFGFQKLAGPSRETWRGKHPGTLRPRNRVGREATDCFGSAFLLRRLPSRPIQNEKRRHEPGMPIDIHAGTFSSGGLSDDRQHLPYGLGASIFWWELLTASCGGGAQLGEVPKQRRCCFHGDRFGSGRCHPPQSDGGHR
ncbi:hypothetical protein B0T19DRAFT_409986 [Cercophora scortea]|uniref:Uncharacterized protein n=1 Tax=Cercophora scortea TaxID=314031 RepID=A0AAE0ML81_9PEZI|nr:hypothetical protein B0T19DRAFT_409986 [Cercophora scortea]